MILKVLSWNIWIDGYFDQIAHFLKESNADIIGLQEVKDDDPKRDVIGYLSKLGYAYVFAPVEKAWGGDIYHDGPAIFSKYPIIRSEISLLSKTDSRAAVRADIQVEERLVHVFSTHLIHTHQKESPVQEEQGANLLQLLPHDHVIVMGDFNAIPESTVIQNMKHVLVDSNPSADPTWSVYPAGCATCNPQNIDIRLDYIFTSNDIQVKSFEVGDSQGSDHLPISATIEF